MKMMMPMKKTVKKPAMFLGVHAAGDFAFICYNHSEYFRQLHSPAGGPGF
ncbi:hypothetical protein [Desulfotruncus arcticus]|nr:hypothetical protein [Desulfotruncus arcticus]